VPDNLPATLKELWCAYNQITLLPNDLPATLTRLWCSGNKITTLPDNLPATLEELYCSYNQITSLPNHLPATLKELLCKNNLLTSLPDTLPDTLILFNCSDNPLESNYPLIFTFKPQQAKEIIAYIRECNSMRRVHARTRKINTCNVLLERYMQRAMHPSRLAPLLADPNIDVDAFMEAYVAAL
jgi:Leucine-rich repeat (LRR) protein